MRRHTCGNPVTAKELDLGVDVMHECSTEEDDSTLGILSVSEAATQVASWESHVLSGCTRA